MLTYADIMLNIDGFIASQGTVLSMLSAGVVARAWETVRTVCAPLDRGYSGQTLPGRVGIWFPGGT